LVNQRKKQPSQPWPSKLLSALLSNPKITLAGVVVLVLAFVALSSKGCGGGEKSPDPKPSKALKSVTAKLIVTTPENASSEQRDTRCQAKRRGKVEKNWPACGRG
jgi:hypothetical protein